MLAVWCLWCLWCLWLLSSLLAIFNRAGDPQIDFLSATIEELITLLETGQTTSEHLINSYVARIHENNYRGLQLHAVIEIAPYESLLLQARERDGERRRGQVRGPLHGVPLLLKDNIATESGLGMNTTSGSLALRTFRHVPSFLAHCILVGSIVLKDSTVVDKLRKAGAIILGKSNLSEFCHVRGNTTWGWSARGGQTQSAYVVGGYRSLSH